MSAALLVQALRDPASTRALDAQAWTGLLCAARAESLIGTLATRLDGEAVPAAVAPILADVRASAEGQCRAALWEVEMARRALGPAGFVPILLKGSAYAAAGLEAAEGRSIGDLDILVPRDRLDATEAALLDAGWEWVKPDPYDDAYYRRWMHELPPLIHRGRDRMIDVHHTILPLTARPMPDAAMLVAESVAVAPGVRVLSSAHMLIHAAAHLIADGDLSGGLRNLWDIDRLYRQFAAGDPAFHLDLVEEAHHHQLGAAVLRALRLAHGLYGTPVPSVRSPLRLDLRLTLSDRLFLRRLLARDGWGRANRPATRLAYYARSHLLRMPPGMLARHLWIKWRKGRSEPA